MAPQRIDPWPPIYAEAPGKGSRRAERACLGDGPPQANAPRNRPPWTGGGRGNYRT